MIGLPLTGAPGQPGAGEFELPITFTAVDIGLQLFLEVLVLDPTGPIGLTHCNGCAFVVGN